MNSPRSLGWALVCLVVGCSGEAPGEGGGNVVAPEPRVAIAPDGAEVGVGDTIRMRAWALPPQEVAAWLWSVSPRERATIDQAGNLVPGSAGEIEVRACADLPKRICGGAPLTIR